MICVILPVAMFTTLARTAGAPFDPTQVN
jgi:hypothetical protein